MARGTWGILPDNINPIIHLVGPCAHIENERRSNLARHGH
jgi:hypothetical protein